MGGQTMPIMASNMGHGPGMGQVNNFSQGLGQPGQQLTQLQAYAMAHPGVQPGYTGGGINYGAVPTGLCSVGPTVRPTLPAFAHPTVYQPGQTQANRVPNQLIRGTSAVPGQANFAPMHR